MVNKVAVIAIVAILAVPILIGFGMNLEPTTKTEYLPDNEQLNVTELLKNGIGYSYAHGDPYQLNTNFETFQGASPTEDGQIYPVYTTATDTVSSLKASYFYRTSIMADFNLSGCDFFFQQMDYNPSVGQVTVTIYDGGTTVATIAYAHTINIDYKNGVIKYTHFQSGQGYKLYFGEVSITGATWIHADSTGDVSSMKNYGWYNLSTSTKYIDLSKGFYFTGVPNKWRINMPENTRKVTLTINLDSVTDSSFMMGIKAVNNYYYLSKTTLGSVYWDFIQSGNPTELYLDPNRTDNTYQISFETVKYKTDSTYEYYTEYITLKYVGGWPSQFGEANYYKTYTFTQNYKHPISSPDDISINDLTFISYNNSNNITKTPVMRVDDAYFRSFEYPTIADEEYNPSSFKTNPSTKISSITQYGLSITFAGNEYNVGSDGNITVGTHKVSLSNIILDSVPVTGGYNNRINGITISTTAQPSTIIFNGQWAANIQTDSQSINTYQTTVWHAGEFAWDGMDGNFLIVGLITSIAAFLGLGIYARKSNSKGVIPLMIVCGGAAVLFFVML